MKTPAAAPALTVARAAQKAFYIVVASSCFVATLLGMAVVGLVMWRRLLFMPKLQFALRTHDFALDL